ncbi:MAG: S8 family serine peptidase [Gemmatimonadaceae bacterium]
MPLNNAYDYSVVGSGVRIWIIDTGVNRYESDLAGRIDESWYVTNNGKDPYAPCHDHGTRVARVAAGTTNGVAKQATVHAARVDVDCTTGSMSTGAASFAFEFIGDHSPRPAVANYSAGRECSWWGCGQTVDDAAKYARSKGVTVIVAAGNDGRDACDYTPAHTAELLTVGASDMNDYRHVHPGWWSSNYGSCIDLFAPVEDAGGTSLAAPMVTGVAALHLQLYPSASPSSVESAVLSKTTNGGLSNIGSGSPNRLLYSKQLPLVTSIQGPDTIGQRASCTWDAYRTGGQPPYSHQWRQDGVVVSNTTSYSVNGGQTSDFTLELYTTDGVGRTHWAVKYVSIDPNNLEKICLW